MKTKVLSILYSFIAGASIATVGEKTAVRPEMTYDLLVDKEPTARAIKLEGDQSKEILDLKVSGVDVYVISVDNPSRRSYSISSSSFNDQVLNAKEAFDEIGQKPNLGIMAGFSIAGCFYTPLGIIGNLYSFPLLKKGKIFEGKLRAMILDQDAIAPYSQLHRIVVVKGGEPLNQSHLELVDIDTAKIKKIEIS